MPIYEYKCTACGHALEAMQKISEEPLKKCPQCHKDALQKLISAAGFQLKGTGWYATDFRNKGKPPSKETSTESQNTNQKSDSSGEKTGDKSTSASGGSET
jgi:putative FmdB family regulatory protein